MTYCMPCRRATRLRQGPIDPAAARRAIPRLPGCEPLGRDHPHKAATGVLLTRPPVQSDPRVALLYLKPRRCGGMAPAADVLRCDD